MRWRIQHSVLPAAAVVHLALLVGVSARDTLRLIDRGATIFSPSSAKTSDDSKLSAAGDGVKRRALQIIVRTYRHVAGIEAGFGFFAPNVPHGFRLRIAITGEDGELARGVLEPHRGETDLRTATLLDTMGRTAPGVIRETMFRLLATSLFEEHPEATALQFAVDVVKVPGAEELRRGAARSYIEAYSYDFRRGDLPAVQP